MSSNKKGQYIHKNRSEISKNLIFSKRKYFIFRYASEMSKLTGTLIDI